MQVVVLYVRDGMMTGRLDSLVDELSEEIESLDLIRWFGKPYCLYGGHSRVPSLRVHLF